MFIITKAQLSKIGELYLEKEVHEASCTAFCALVDNFYSVDTVEFDRIVNEAVADFKKYEVTKFQNKCYYLYASYIFGSSVFSMNEFFSEMMDHIIYGSDLGFMVEANYIDDKVNLLVLS